jgi:hypothetical protein
MHTSTSRNKLKTPGYFVKRLRDNGFIVLKLFAVYGKQDPRRWTVMVNPSERSVMITCYNNKNEYGDVSFEINDGGFNMPKNMFINTNSIEVIVDYLISHGVSNNSHYTGRNRYVTNRLNNNDEGQKTIEEKQQTTA